MPKTEKPKIDDPRDPPVQFRASEIVLRQLEDLMQRWGENRSQTIVRAIERTWAQEIGQSLQARIDEGNRRADIMGQALGAYPPAPKKSK